MMITVYTSDVNEDPEELQRIKLQRKKNEEELNKLCKNICLCLGWLSVLILFIYFLFIIINSP